MEKPTERIQYLLINVSHPQPNTWCGNQLAYKWIPLTYFTVVRLDISVVTVNSTSTVWLQPDDVWLQWLTGSDDRKGGGGWICYKLLALIA